MNRLKVGQIVEVEVTAIKEYGVFVKLEDNYTGLIHISEIANKYIKNVNDFCSIGNILNAKILDIDEDKLQVKLSLRKIRSNKEKAKLVEKGNGFEPLRERLDMWISLYNDKIV